MAIPVFDASDQLAWTTTSSGQLSLKASYLHQASYHADVSWAKAICSSSIPPSKSFLAWRILHNRMPTDENLSKRGCITVSICSLCYKDAETTTHLFFGCSFAHKLWSWLSDKILYPINTNSLLDVFGTGDRSWSPQVKEVFRAAVINIIWVIWFSRNQIRFNNKAVTYQAAINMVLASTSLSSNCTTAHMHSTVAELAIMKHFKVDGHPRRATNIIQIDWHPPPCGWIKVNTEGTAKGSPGHTGGEGIFRDHSGAVLGCFAKYYGITDSFHAKLLAAMHAITVAKEKGWHCLWLECDSTLVIQSIASPDLVPWRLRTTWRNCLQAHPQTLLTVSHIYREGNNCADRLAAFGLANRNYTWWDSIPSSIRPDFFRNRLDCPIIDLCPSVMLSLYWLVEVVCTLFPPRPFPNC